MGPRNGNNLFYSTFTADENESVELECRRREIYENEVLEQVQNRNSRPQVEDLEFESRQSFTVIQRMMEFMSSETIDGR